MRLGALFGYAAEQENSLRQNQFSNTASVGKRCVENRNATTGSRLQVYLVGTNTETTHSNQFLGCFKNLGSQLGARAKAYKVRIGNLLNQVFLGQRVTEVLNVGVTCSIQGIQCGLVHAFQQQNSDFALFERRR